MLKAGYKANVIPGSAEAVVDCRILPGHAGEFEATVDELIGAGVTREWITDLLPNRVVGVDPNTVVPALNAILGPGHVEFLYNGNGG